MKKLFVLTIIFALVLAGCEEEDTNTTLKIKNESFTEITEVIWQNVSFSNNQYENSIKTGTSVINNVEPGAGYIFFKRKANPITARTNDLIIIENNKQIEFTFIDNTLIVEVHNPNNNGTLGAVQNTVVWWDDAEGDILPYAQRRNVDYTTSSPRYGGRCIGFGYSAELTFSLVLTKKAKLSFWHRFSSYYAYLKINSEEIKKWETDNSWSFFECDIEAGNTIIQFTTSSSSSGLYLDDLLVCYTE